MFRSAFHLGMLKWATGLCAASVLLLGGCGDGDAPSSSATSTQVDPELVDVRQVDQAPAEGQAASPQGSGYASGPNQGAAESARPGRITPPSRGARTPARRGATASGGPAAPDLAPTHPTRAADVPLPKEMAAAIKDPRYAGFRSMCTRYNELRVELQPI